MPEDRNPNIRVEITDASEFHCFRLLLNPKYGECRMCGGTGFSPVGGRGVPCDTCHGQGRISMPGSGIEIMLHARSLVDLIHKCSLALCDWQAQTSQQLIKRMMEASLQEAPDPYRDDAFAERRCDRCDKPYRGPSVYCSLDCAREDAG